MANYHLSIKIFSRGSGASAIAKAAYRAAEILKSEYDGQTHDYTHKRGVVHKEILLPDHAPAEYADRSILWNAVEMGERNINAQLAREVEISLPVELTREQNIALAREFVKRTFVEKGMCADVCVHDKNDGNPHAHIMLTMRPLEPDGSWGAKSRKEYILDGRGERIKLKSGEFKTRKICTVDWNEPTKAEEWRAAWEDMQNAALERYGHGARVDHRSYERQGVDKIPTVHLGVAASQMERRGIRTELGDKNREIAVSNKQLRSLRARINKLSDWLKDEAANTTPPTLYDIITGILSGDENNSQYRQIANLQMAAKVLIFLQRNNISELSELQAAVRKMNSRVNGMREKMKPIERRMNTLNEHIKQAELIKEHSKTYKMYQQEKPKHREAFFEQFRRELTLYQSADRYLKGVLNGRTKIPLAEWKEEKRTLTAESGALKLEYDRLKEEVREVENIKRVAENIMQAAAPEREVERRKNTRSR